MAKLPIDSKTSDTTTWRYIGSKLPAMPADGMPLIVDVLQRRHSPNKQLARCETQYLGDGEFYSVYGETVYWSYQRPMPTEYVTEAEASADLDVCGYAGKWKVAKQSVSEAQPDAHEADYWLAVRLYFLELGGCYLSERCEPTPIDWKSPLPMPIIPRLPYQEPMKVREG